MIFSTFNFKDNGLFIISKTDRITESVDDHRISKVLRNENELTLSVLYNRLIQPLYNYGMHTCQDKDIVMSCLEEIFKQFRQKREPLPDLNSGRVYIFKTFRTLLNKRLGKQLRLQSLSAVPLLTRMQMEVILLKFVNGFNYLEVSVIIELPLESVYDVLKKAIKVLTPNQKSYDEMVL